MPGFLTVGLCPVFTEVNPIITVPDRNVKSVLFLDLVVLNDKVIEVVGNVTGHAIDECEHALGMGQVGQVKVGRSPNVKLFPNLSGRRTAGAEHSGDGHPETAVLTWGTFTHSHTSRLSD